MCEEAGKLCGFSCARRRPRITQTNTSDELQKATCNSKPVCKQNSAVPRGSFKVFQRIRLQKRIAPYVCQRHVDTLSDPGVARLKKQLDREADFILCRV
jgi:hypothetical protein